MDWYPHQAIEKKWQERWQQGHHFLAVDSSDKPKRYILVEYPYPSGEGLHMGHVRSYSALDAMARKARMDGQNVLFPIGWDAFGLPTENYAIKTGIHPRTATDRNIATYRRQLRALGLSFDWSREVDTTDPTYYKWTQWIFLQLFKKGLAYQATMPINWCPKDKIGLANEEVVQGKCERCGTDVVRKEQKQWVLKITAYADRLIDDLKLVDFPERVKTSQINWIGRSEGAEIDFQVVRNKEEGRSKEDFVKVFTTRPDTIFGATYLVLSPEHSIMQNEKLKIENWEEVQKYIKKVAKKSDLERTDLAKEKTGIELKGITAINPANGENIPIWVADYVLPHYGAGAIMAVPAHDERDWEFAKKFGLEIREVITPYEKNVAILYGLSGKPNENWFPWLQNSLRAKGIATQTPVLPNSDHPNLEEWTAFLQKTLAKQETNKLTLVGHSLGASAAIQFVLKNNAPIDTLVLVAPTNPEQDWKHLTSTFPDYDWKAVQSFTNAPLDEKKLRSLVRRIVIFYSDDDPYIPEKSIEYFRKNIPWAEFHKISGKGHFNTSAGVTEFPEVLGLFQEVFTGEGVLINSDRFNGMEAIEAGKKISKWLEEKGIGKKAITYKLRDWIFSRQHYWGEPIPIVHCPDHGAVPVPDDQLPVELPFVEKYEPSGTGESPLSAIPEFVNTTCPVCGKPAKRETDTMPNWAGSSWYYLRYCDPQNDREFAEFEKLRYWLPVDLYNGGMEHTTLHLLYSRFWHKFLFDQKLVPGPEPYKRRVSHGIVLGEDGRKMSKSFGNVANPDDLIREYGADAIRTYEMFMGPYEDTIPWATRGLIGVHRFLQNVYDLATHMTAPEHTVQCDLEFLTHKTIKRVSEDLDGMRFNTAVSALMEFSNALRTVDRSDQFFLKAVTILLLLVYPMAPHLASELWERSGEKGDIADQQWPTFDPKKLVQKTITLVVQVNGKVRAKLTVPSDIGEAEATKAALAEPNVRKFVPGEPKKVVFVPGRLINILV